MDLFNFLQMYVLGIRQGVYLNYDKAQSDEQSNEKGIFWCGNHDLMDIAYIKVSCPPFVGGRLGEPGRAIAIHTNKDSLLLAQTGIECSILTSYSSIREFYSPYYSATSLLQKQIDNRTTTLYWSQKFENQLSE